MKPSEAYSAGIFPHLYDWMDHAQVAGNRVKWRASVEQLGERWVYLLVQQRLDPKVRDLPVRKASK